MQSCYDKQYYIKAGQQLELYAHTAAHTTVGLNQFWPVLVLMITNVFCYVSFAWFGGACTTQSIKGTIDIINDF